MWALRISNARRKQVDMTGAGISHIDVWEGVYALCLAGVFGTESLRRTRRCGSAVVININALMKMPIMKGFSFMAIMSS